MRGVGWGYNGDASEEVGVCGRVRDGDRGGELWVLAAGE